MRVSQPVCVRERGLTDNTPSFGSPASVQGGWPGQSGHLGSAMLPHVPHVPWSPGSSGHLVLLTASFPTASPTHPNLGLRCCESLV